MAKQKKTTETFGGAFFEAYREERDRIWRGKAARIKLHHSFRLSRREDSRRESHLPGLVSHASMVFKIIFKNWKLFGGLIVMVLAGNMIVANLMSEETYRTAQNSLKVSYEGLANGQIGKVAESALLLISTVTTGGLKGELNEVDQLVLVILFAIIWLVSIFFLRQLLAGKKPKFRDGIFNALSPLISSICVVGLILLHMLPIFIVTIVYSTAVSTEFLVGRPLYAFVFWLFSSLLMLLSLYLLPSSVMGLVATSVPGIYPMTALHAATDLVQGRRIKLITHVSFCLICLAITWVLIMVPLIWLDLNLKEAFSFLGGIPFIPVCLQIMMSYSAIYFTAYIYLLYRRMLDDPS